MENKQFEQLIEALGYVAESVENSGNKVSFEVDDYNMLSYIGEALFDISKTLKQIEAKMK